jgi:hypothetical protein
MAKQLALSGLKELRSYLNTVDLKKSVFILFTGDKTESNGKSWCPDCNGKFLFNTNDYLVFVLRYSDRIFQNKSAI